MDALALYQVDNDVENNNQMQEPNKASKENKHKLKKPCRDYGRKDLCNELICEYDGQCRSGCCTQVLTKGYSRCTAMLIGDYCPRALEPIYDMLEAIGDLTTDTEALDDVMTKDVAAEQHYEGIAAHDIV